MTRFTAIINVDGSVTEVPFTAEEEAARDIAEAEYAAAEPARKWSAIRAQRDQLLATSDWRAMPDAPTMSADWATYREALRNLPSTQSDPDDIVFPTEPT
tara:strand:- start:91 stop:390 length:300 start_codon:yes stop_codon:yes gene_type:complete